MSTSTSSQSTRLPPELWERVILLLYPSAIPRLRLVIKLFPFSITSAHPLMVTDRSARILRISLTAPQKSGTNSTSFTQDSRMDLEATLSILRNAGDNCMSIPPVGTNSSAPRVRSSHSQNTNRINSRAGSLLYYWTRPYHMVWATSILFGYRLSRRGYPSRNGGFMACRMPTQDWRWIPSRDYL